MAVSQQYIDQYQKLHAQDPLMFSGQQTLYVKDYIEFLIKKFNCKTMLDYGCGKGLQYTVEKANENWGVELTLFDIGVKEFSIKPKERYDLVSSTDMLEHCETSDIPEILKEINDYANLSVIVSISTREAKKILPDGRNAHLTVKPKEWWMEQIHKISDKPWLILFEGTGIINNKDLSRDFDIEVINLDKEEILGI